MAYRHRSLEDGSSIQSGAKHADRSRTDPELVRAIRNPKNYVAWETFEGRYAPMIRSYCVARGFPSCDADDVAQEVFLRVSKYGFADRYDPDRGTFRSYLFRVTRSVASRALSLQKDLPRDLDVMDDSQDVWDEVWRTQSLRLAVNKVERTASATSRSVLSLMLRGARPSIIAETTGISLHAVYKARSRLRSSIELALGEFLLDPLEI